MEWNLFAKESPSDFVANDLARTSLLAAVHLRTEEQQQRACSKVLPTMPYKQRRRIPKEGSCSKTREGRTIPAKPWGGAAFGRTFKPLDAAPLSHYPTGSRGEPTKTSNGPSSKVS